MKVVLVLEFVDAYTCSMLLVRLLPRLGGTLFTISIVLILIDNGDIDDDTDDVEQVDNDDDMSSWKTSDENRFSFVDIQFYAIVDCFASR